jgi:hypothetical protein
VSPRTRASCDAASTTAVLAAAVWIGSGLGVHLDPALLGYLAATLVAIFTTTYRASLLWRRRPSAFYARALLASLRDPRRLREALGVGARDLGAQRFIGRRSRLRGVAHLLLSSGTLAAFAITLPLVFGWLRFEAVGQDVYRALVLSTPVGDFRVDGPMGWLVFHALDLSAVAVTLGATWFIAVRLRDRRLPGVAAGAHLAPLALLLAVALTGLLLPASRGAPELLRVVSRLHEGSVVMLLVALPFSKLVHVLLRPLHVGARLVRAPNVPRAACIGCGADLAPAAQLAAVEQVLAERGFGFEGHQRRCPACRRRRIAAAQAALLRAQFHPPLLGACSPVGEHSRECA